MVVIVEIGKEADKLRKSHHEDKMEVGNVAL